MRSWHCEFLVGRMAVAAAAWALLGPVFAQSAATPEVSVEAKADTAPAAPSRWSLQLPKTDPVAFKGVASFDAAGMPGAAVMYPAPNVGGFLAAVIVHGLINESSKNAQKASLQQAADKVLDPYRPILSTYTHAELMRSMPGDGHGASQAEPPIGAEWQVESVPLFALTQDHSALVLENAIIVRKAGTAGPAAYQSNVKVVSSPIDDPEPMGYWNRENGKHLRQEAGGLLQESIDLAVSAAARSLPETSASHKTYRYPEGKIEKMERAALVVDRCARIVLRTLRDTLLSVPGNSKSPACGAVAAN